MLQNNFFSTIWICLKYVWIIGRVLSCEISVIFLRQVIPVGSSTGTILAARCWLPKSFLLESVQGPNTHTFSNHLWAADQRVRGLALDQLQFKLPRVTSEEVSSQNGVRLYKILIAIISRLARNIGAFYTLFARLPWQSMPKWPFEGLIGLSSSLWQVEWYDMADVKALQCSSGHHAGHLHLTPSLKSGKCLRMCLLDHFCLRTGAASLLSSSLERDTGRVCTAGLFTVGFLRFCGGQIVHKSLYHYILFLLPCTLNFLLFPTCPSMLGWCWDFVVVVWTLEFMHCERTMLRTAKGFRARTHAYRTNLLSSLLKHDRQLPLRWDWFFSCLPQSCSWDTAKRQHAVDACWHFSAESDTHVPELDEAIRLCCRIQFFALSLEFLTPLVCHCFYSKFGWQCHDIWSYICRRVNQT